MLRMLFWTVLTITAVLGLLWAVHDYVPGVSGLGDLNDIMGITAGVCAVATLVLFFVPRPGQRQGDGADHPGAASNTSTANRIEGGEQGTAIQAGTIEGGVQTRSYGGDHVDFSGGTFNAPVTGKRDTGPAPQDGE